MHVCNTNKVDVIIFYSLIVMTNLEITKIIVHPICTLYSVMDIFRTLTFR